MEKLGKNIVFAYYVDDEFKGFRQDSFGTIGKDWAKIYTYSPSQVEIIRKNVQDELSMIGSLFMKTLFSMKNPIVMNLEGETLNQNKILEQVSKNENEMRSWKEFEVRIIPFCSRKEFADMCVPGEEYKKQQFLSSLEPAIEILKFKVVDNEN